MSSLTSLNLDLDFPSRLYAWSLIVLLINIVLVLDIRMALQLQQIFMNGRAGWFFLVLRRWLIEIDRRLMALNDAEIEAAALAI